MQHHVFVLLCKYWQSVCTCVYCGMKERCTPVEVSHTKVESVVGNGMSFRIREEGEDRSSFSSGSVS